MGFPQIFLLDLEGGERGLGMGRTKGRRRRAARRKEIF